MTFTVGGVDVTAVHVGPTAAVAVYLGATKVWPAKSPPDYTDTFDVDITGWTAHGPWAWSADYGGTASKSGRTTDFLISPVATFGTADADVQVDIIGGVVHAGPSHQWGLVLDFVDADNFILVRVEPALTHVFEIYDCISGTYTLRGRGGHIPGPDFTLRATKVGTHVTCYADGVEQVSGDVSVAALRDGGTGLYSKIPDVRFDNWSQTAS